MADLVGPILVAALVMLVRGLWQGMGSSDGEQSWHAFGGTETVPLAEVKEGELVRVSGRVRALEPLVTAPVTGRPCAAFVLDIGESRRVQHGWAGPAVPQPEQVFVHRRQAVMLALEDGQHTALLRLEPSVLWLGYAEGEQNASTDPRPKVAALLDERGVKWRRLFRMRPIVWSERLLQPGDGVLVMGYARREPGLLGASDGSYREAPTQLVLVGTRQHPLLLTNLPERGAPMPAPTVEAG